MAIEWMDAVSVLLLHRDEVFPSTETSDRVVAAGTAVVFQRTPIEELMER